MQTPNQVAKSANVSVQSIRNWSREYGDLLSPSARGEEGPRQFNEADLEVILTVAALRKSGMATEEVRQQIRNKGEAAVIDVGPQNGLQSNPQWPKETLQAGHDTPQAQSDSPQMAYNAIQSRIDTLEHRFLAQVALGRAQQLERWWSFGMGMWVGMVTMGCVFFAVWIAVNGV